jgi:two-component system OmpR family response regulator
LKRELLQRVLIVEGDPAERERVAGALGPYCALTFASSAREALAAVQSAGPDLVVTELDLADGDGLALCAQLRTLPQTHHLPIMVLTGRAGIQDKVDSFQAGADDYVVKPLDTRLFYARVRFLCRIKRLEHPHEDW